VTVPTQGFVRAAPLPAAVWRTAIVLATGSVMAGLDTSLVNVGMDTISGSLGASLAATQWINSGYLLALAAALPACGWLGRRFGDGRLWFWALAGFTFSSALCAFAPDIGLLIAARALQGLTGGLLIPAGMAVLGGLAGPGGMGRMVAISSVPAILAPAFGPVLGALLIASLSWHWLFLLNVPIGLVGLLAGWRWVPRGDPDPAVGRLDVAGLASVGVGLPLTVYALTEVTGADVTAPATWLPLLVGTVLLACFVRRSLRSDHPLLDLRLVRNRVFAAASAEVVFGGAALFGGLVVMPLYFQLALATDIVGSGLLLMAFSLGAAATFPVAGSLSDRFGGGLVCTAGLVVAIATTVPMALLPDEPDLFLVEVLQVLRGIGMALAGAPVIAAALAAVERRSMSDASAQVNILSRVGGALGSAIFVVLLAADPTPAGFRHIFWLMTAVTVIALAAAVWLALEQHRARYDLRGEHT
jgi:EmrB/QacA subfamily drug resistance transporter